MNTYYQYILEQVMLRQLQTNVLQLIIQHQDNDF